MANSELTNSYETFNTASEWKDAVDKFIREVRSHEEYEYDVEDRGDEDNNG